MSIPEGSSRGEEFDVCSDEARRAALQAIFSGRAGGFMAKRGAFRRGKSSKQIPFDRTGPS